ncbi:MAG TPA: ethanolamine ammonia-lyase light chain EutC [Xanthobacteraceae bacterium]|jgi:ethanolamine ammonia-lyase small subunit|nr:ethanolamine ammonia-lyase light chain EutC [Xanthobacteraceae bacterium]
MALRTAGLAAMLIGERSGLSAPDSAGAYLTWRPHAGTTNADRNCIFNIRPEGINHDAVVFKLAPYLRAMRARLVGLRLKDGSDRLLVGS